MNSVLTLRKADVGDGGQIILTAFGSDDPRIGKIIFRIGLFQQLDTDFPGGPIKDRNGYILFLLYDGLFRHPYQQNLFSLKRNRPGIKHADDLKAWL